MDKTAKHIPVA